MGMKESFEKTPGLKVGDMVQFQVKQGSKGPHAVNLSSFVEQAALSHEVYTGVIKSFNGSKGWGFIESELAKQHFQQDIFLHEKTVKGLKPAIGQQVQFSVDISSSHWC